MQELMKAAETVEEEVDKEEVEGNVSKRRKS